MRGKDEYNVKFQSEDGCEGVLSRDGGGVPSEMERLSGRRFKKHLTVERLNLRFVLELPLEICWYATTCVTPGFPARAHSISINCIITITASVSASLYICFINIYMHYILT